MSEEGALLAAICAEPEEDTPRLAYADWLDEHAGSLPKAKRESARLRAELIRVQCALFRMPPEEEDADSATSRVELENREAELLKNTNRRQAWAKPFGREVGVGRDAGRFIRGFARYASGTPGDYFAAGEALFDVSPVHEISCNWLDAASTNRLLALPWLGRVRRFYAHANFGDEAAVAEKVFAAPSLANVEDLTLSAAEFVSPGGPVGNRPLAALRRLELQGGGNGRPDTLARLGELLPADLRLRELYFSVPRQFANEPAPHDLGAPPQLGSLERLVLFAEFARDRPHRPGVEGACALAARLRPTLRSLRLSGRSDRPGEGLTATEVEALAAALAPNLRALALPVADADAFAALADSPLLATVTALSVSAPELEGDDLLRLARSPRAGNLVRLNLGGCGVGTAGMQALGRAAFAPNLVWLGVSRCTVGKAGVDVLCDPAAFPRLRYLRAYQAVRDKAQQERLRARFGSALLL